MFDPSVLAEVDVPAAAVVYVEDPFVERELSLETAALVPSLRTWVTNEYLHGGLRHGGGDLLDRLLGMTKAAGRRPRTRLRRAAGAPQRSAGGPPARRTTPHASRPPPRARRRR